MIIRAASGFVLPEYQTRPKPNFHYPNRPETRILLPEVPETRKKMIYINRKCPNLVHYPKTRPARNPDFKTRINPKPEKMLPEAALFVPYLTGFFHILFCD